MVVIRFGRLLARGMYAFIIVSVVLVLSACGYTEPLTERDCAVEGLGATLEGNSNAFDFGGSARVAGITLRNAQECAGLVQIYARTPSGSAACIGENATEFCNAEAGRQPIAVTPDQLRDLMSP